MHVDVYSSTQTHTRIHTNSCFSSWGRRLYCCPWMGENFNATQPLLLKHRLTLSLSLWCLTAVSHHLHLNYIHSRCIRWQGKCWAATVCIPLHPFPLFPSISISLTVHSFKISSVQIGSKTFEWSWSHSFCCSLQSNSGVTYWGELTIRVTYPLVWIVLMQYEVFLGAVCLQYLVRRLCLCLLMCVCVCWSMH